MIPYEFSVLRYTHDGVTNEFVNIGVAVYSGDSTYLKARCTGHYGRISRMFDRIDGDRFRQMVRHIEDTLNKLGLKLRQQAMPFAQYGTTIQALVREVLPADDSAIQFSQPGYGVSADLDATLRQLYDRYVDQYAGEQEVPSRSDEEVWRVFRTPLEKLDLLPRLLPKRIIAPDYEYQFRAGWRNDVWHVYEPVSFDLVEASSLLEKANRWVGRAANLIESPERFRIHLLLGEPQDEHLRDAFRKSYNILHKMPGGPELVLESQAGALAAEIDREIGLHDGKEGLLDLR